MSTGANCRFTEVKPGQWTYWLQDYPYGATEEGQTFGPFRSFSEAYEHLHANHANPGGYSTYTHEQHVHEWKEGSAWVPVGFEVKVRVESLGPDADRLDVIRHVQQLDPNHPAFNVRPVEALRDGITSCEACGKQR